MYNFFFLSCIKFISCYSKTSPAQASPLYNSPKYFHIITLLYDSDVIPNLDNLCWNKSRVRRGRTFSFFKEDNFLVPVRSKEEGEFFSCFPPIPFSALHPKAEPREEQPPVFVPSEGSVHPLSLLWSGSKLISIEVLCGQGWDLGSENNSWWGASMPANEQADQPTFQKLCLS